MSLELKEGSLSEATLGVWVHMRRWCVWLIVFCMFYINLLVQSVHCLWALEFPWSKLLHTEPLHVVGFPEPLVTLCWKCWGLHPGPWKSRQVLSMVGKLSSVPELPPQALVTVLATGADSGCNYLVIEVGVPLELRGRGQPGQYCEIMSQPALYIPIFVFLYCKD